MTAENIKVILERLEALELQVAAVKALIDRRFSMMSAVMAGAALAFAVVLAWFLRSLGLVP